MNPEGPYVSVAAICESVLVEKDEKITCVRFIDALNVKVATPNLDKPTVIRLELKAFIAFKSGSFIGTKNCTLRLINPSGKSAKVTEMEPKTYPMTFKGEGHGHNLIVMLNLPVSETGLYWFDVMLDDEVYSRIPLKITVTRSLLQRSESESSEQTSDHPA